MSVLTSTSLIPESPETRALTIRSQTLPDIVSGVDAMRREMSPALQIANDHAAETAQEEARVLAERKQPREAPDPDPVASAPFRVDAVPSFAPQSHAAPRESVAAGVATAALGTAAVASVLPAFNAAVIAPTAKLLAAGAMPAASQLGVTFGLPAAGAAVGFYLGKKIRHPVAGAVAGAGAGMAGTFWALPAVGQTALSLNAGAVAMTTAAATTSMLTGAGIAAGVGGALYGLGRWHEKVRGSKPGGILKTMARGVVAPASISWTYFKRAIGRPFVGGVQAA